MIGSRLMTTLWSLLGKKGGRKSAKQEEEEEEKKKMMIIVDLLFRFCCLLHDLLICGLAVCADL